MVGSRTKWAVAGSVVAALALAGCSGGTKDAAPVTETVTVEASPTAVEEPVKAPPTNEEVKQAFQAYVDERADSGVMLAQAVTDITVADGVVTVHMDPEPVVLELSPFGNLAELFGTPAAFNDDEGIWLRQTVNRVDVVDANGNSLGSMTTEALNKKAAG